MISTLHHFMNSNKAAAMPRSRHKSSRYDIVARLYYLFSKLSDEQKQHLLKQLLRDKTDDYLLKLIIDLSDNQRRVLMSQLEEITLKASRYDRRKHPRKNCLMTAGIRIAGQAVDCFILDISPYGAFIDTGEGLAAGHTARLNFFSPNNREELKLTVKIVWSESQGAGLQFHRLTARQLEQIRSFAQNEQTVYEITS
jgi:hypothetical protein